MTIEDFEWREEGALPPATEPAGQRARGSVTARLLKRLTDSVWLEPALKLSGMAALLGVLAAIGVVATTYAKPGLALPDGPRQLAAALGTSWLKPVPGQAAPAVASAARSAPSAREPEPYVVAGGAGGQAATAVAAPLAPGTTAETAPERPAPAGITAEGKVILNSASAEELTRLPGVGLKRAQAIVALRAKLKRFKHPSDLLRVKGIGPRGLQRMLPHLVLDA